MGVDLAELVSDALAVGVGDGVKAVVVYFSLILRNHLADLNRK